MAWNISTALASVFFEDFLADFLDSETDDFVFSGLSSPRRIGVAIEKANAIAKKPVSFRFMLAP